MKKVHLLPNVITAFALSCGLFVIFKLNMTPLGEVDAQLLTQSAGILLLAVFADLLDGAVARAIKAESDFGGFFDSLADAISFGVAPSVIVLKTFSMPPGTELSFLLTTAAMVFSVCGVLRLVRFSVVSQQVKVDAELSTAHKKHFTGLPIPAAAASVVSLNLFLLSEHFTKLWTLDDTIRAWILIFALMFIGYLMVSRWKFPSLKSLRLRVASFQLVLLTVLSAVVIFYGVLQYFAVVFFAVSWIYILIALSLSFVRLVTGNKSKTLEDFEPDPEDFEYGLSDDSDDVSKK